MPQSIEKTFKLLPLDDYAYSGVEVLVYLNQATVELVRLAWWVSEEDEDYPNHTGGWWSYRNCVGQELLDWEPTHYIAPELRHGT